MAYTGTKAQAGRGTVVSIGANISITGDTTSASTSVTSVSSTTGISVGMPISGAGIPSGTTVAAVGSGTLTLSAAATATAAGVALTVDASNEIGECDSFPMDRPEWKFADVTNFDSGDDAEKIPTIRDTATFTLTGNRVSSDAGQTAVETAYENATIESFTVTLPKTSSQTVSGDEYTFKAYVLAANFNVKTEEAIKFSIKLMTSGGVTYAAGS